MVIPKFICDSMLLNLGRWLRTAGYDTVFASPYDKDFEIQQKALKENRWLLSCDKDFFKFEGYENYFIYFETSTLERSVKKLSSHLFIDWLYRPFSRCLLCNILFSEPEENIINTQVPIKVRLSRNKFWQCKNCQKVFWEGTHTKNMREQLEKWAKTSINRL